MRTRMAFLFVLVLAWGCVQAPANVSGAELQLEPGTYVESELAPSPNQDLRIVLHGRGPGSASYELRFANGQVLAHGTLKLADLERSYTAEELPLLLTLVAEGDEPARIEWELHSQAPLDASWTLPAPRDD